MIEDGKLTRLANFPSYKHEPRKVKSDGLFRGYNMILKLYNMVKRENPFIIPYNLGLILMKESRKGKIKPHSGLGFVIISEDTLNVARWDEEYPYVLKNQIYEHSCEGLRIKNMKALDIGEVGSFCAWELGIVAHETEAWQRFLASLRTNADKQKYLEDRISGDL